MEQLNESSLSRIWGQIQKYSCGCVTTFRKSNVYAQNIANNKRLKAFLLGRGYLVTKVRGTYIENFKSPNAKEVIENTFFVANGDVEGDDGGVLEADLIAMGKLFDQDSVLIIPVGGDGAYLYGTSQREDAYPDYETKEVVGNETYGDKVAERFYSRIRGRKFAFESYEECLPPDSNMGLWAMHLVYRSVLKELNQVKDDDDLSSLYESSVLDQDKLDLID